MADSGVQRVPLQVARGCVVASIQIDLTPEVLQQFRMDLLERVQESRANGVILDVSGIDILDLDDFNALRKTMEMAEIMGGYNNQVTTTARSVPTDTAPTRLWRKRWSGRLLKNTHISGTSMSGITDPTTTPGNSSLLLVLDKPNARG